MSTQELQTLQAKAKEIKELIRMKEEVEAEIQGLQDDIKRILEEKQVDEIVAGEYKIRYKEVVSNRFDSNLFKEKYIDLYKQFLKSTSSKRFTIA